MKSKPRVLYIAYWGAAEPLGQSLVLPAIKKLAALGVDLTLVTFEKPRDLERIEDTKDIGDSLRERGIQWIPLRYHKRPKIPATAFDLAYGCARSIAARLTSRPDIIHARTFAGGLMGLALAPLLGAKLIYHNEGFYPDEQVDAGVWKAGSRPHVIAKYLEHTMYARADGIIALSQLAKKEIEKIPVVARMNTPVMVIPSCVDLGHFPPPPMSIACDGSLRFVYVGGVGGRYGLDKIGRFLAVASRQIPRVNLRVLTNDPKLAISSLSGAGLPSDCWSIDRVQHRAVPAELARRHVGMHFLSQGLSDHGGSPTKIGEYWAAGLPVVVTPNAGDTGEIISNERVGVVVNEHCDAEYHRAVQELRSLLAEDGLAQRCRRAAEAHYALEPACQRQAGLYYTLMSGEAPATISVQVSQLSNPEARPSDGRTIAQARRARA